MLKNYKSIEWSKKRVNSFIEGGQCPSDVQKSRLVWLETLFINF